MHLVASVDNIIRNKHFYNHSKQAIKLTHILKVNFEWKLKSIPVKSVLSILKIYTTVTIYCQYKFLKVKVLEIAKQLLSNF